MSEVLNRRPQLDDGTEPVRRTFEIEDPTNLYFIHPISARLVPIFARLGVTPNAVSLIGMGCGVLAGCAYHFYGHLDAAVAGFVLMLAWHVMDGADGQLARLTKSYSNLGKVLDGVCDYVTFTSVYLGLATAMHAGLGNWVWAIVALAGVCHAIQAASYELQRQEYNFWGWGKQSAALPQPGDLRPGMPWRHRAAAALHRIYARVQLSASGGAWAFHTRMGVLLEARPGRQAALREAYRAHFAPLIRRWGVLGANYRTLGIFIAALLKLPLLYFLFEIVGLTIMLLFLQRAQAGQNAAFFEVADQG